MGRGPRREPHPARAERGGRRRRARCRHRDRLRAEHRPRPGRAAVLHRRLPLPAPVRRHRERSRGAADHRHGARRPLADRHQPQGDRRLAAHGRSRARLRQRDGPGAPALPQQRDRQLAGARGRQAAVRPAGAAAGAGQVHGRAVHRLRAQPAARVHGLRELAAEGDRAVGAEPRAERGRGRRRGCSATCSGPPRSRPTEGSAPSRRTAARAGAARARRRTRCRSRCRRSGRTSRSGRVSRSGGAKGVSGATLPP